MPRLIFSSTKDSDMNYAVKTPITGAFFYLEMGKSARGRSASGRRLAFLDKRDFGLIPRKAGVRTVPVEGLASEAKKFRHKTNDRNKLALAILKKYKIVGKRVEIPIHFPIDMADFLRKNGIKLTPTHPFFRERAKKTKEEIAFITESLAHTKSAFRIIENILRRSRIKGKRIYFKNRILTSELLKQEAEYALIERGMFDLLGMIVSTGAQTAVPHHDGTGPILPHQPIVCDIFPRHRKSGYFADMTRTYVKGRPTPKIQRMYAAVLAAQLAAIKKISASPLACSPRFGEAGRRGGADRRPGIPAKDVYNAAAEVILKAGYDVGEKGMIHGLGHGVGLDIHERPNLKPGSDDILEAGNVITVEPGLYYTKLGGIRIEDMVLVTRTGCKNLTNYPKKLVIP